MAFGMACMGSDGTIGRMCFATMTQAGTRFLQPTSLPVLHLFSTGRNANDR
jgi:hypothetical protein